MLRTRVRAGPVAGLVISLVFAAVFSVIGLGELWFPGAAPSLDQATPVTLRVPYGTRIIVDGRRGGSRLSYEHARIIVPRGTLLSESNDEHRAAFAYESTRRPIGANRLLSFGYAVYFIVSMLLTAYLRNFGQNRVKLLRAQVGVFALIAVALLFGKLILLFTALPEFWIPVAALPLWIALAFDRRTAFLVEVGVAFIAASLLRFDLVLLSVLIIRGITATLVFVNKRRPRTMLSAGAVAGLAGAVAYGAFATVFEGRLDVLGDLGKGLGSNFLACFGGGVLGGVLARTFHEPAERVVGHVSRDKLLELTDLDHPLLRRMAKDAPGSWEHARAMANLAEAATSAIGGDALLVRVGAYYHDLGKTIQPKYYVENLVRGEKSPHLGLPPDLSADAIRAHVLEGVHILRDGGIPEPVVEFAYTHHGTSVIEYFWHQNLKNGNPKNLDDAFFRYPGMRPRTKETGILMLVDAVEAASRTIGPPERKKFEEMVQRVVFNKLRQGQLDESGLTMTDMRVVTAPHGRDPLSTSTTAASYPWQREAEEAAARAQREGAETTPVSVGLRGGGSGPDAAPSATTPPTDDAPASAKRPARP
jgi:putative nucleotidyltransferase with HDIG domain